MHGQSLHSWRRCCQLTTSRRVSWEQKELGGITGGTTTYNVSGSNANIATTRIETENEARQRIFNNMAVACLNRVIYGWENY